eukprot:5716956-Prymnesium_polylepis.2
MVLSVARLRSVRVRDWVCLSSQTAARRSRYNTVFGLFSRNRDTKSADTRAQRACVCAESVDAERQPRTDRHIHAQPQIATDRHTVSTHVMNAESCATNR